VIGGTVVLLDSSKVLHGVGSNGNAVWTCSLDDGVSGSTVYVSGSGQLGVVFAAHSNGTLYSINGTSGVVVWSSMVGASSGYASSAAVWDTSVLIVANNGILYCLYGVTGQVLWQVVDRFASTPSPMITVDDTLVICDVNGNLVGLVVSSGVILWRATLGMALNISQVVLSQYGSMLIGSLSNSSTISYIRTCGSFPSLTATLYDRKTLTYYISYSTMLPTNAMLSMTFLTVNNGKLSFTPQIADATHNGTMYQAAGGATSFQVQCVLQLIPAYGIASSVTVVIVPGTAD